MRPNWSVLARAAFILLSLATVASAEEQSRVVRPDYQQAAQYSSEYLRQFMYDTAVTPRWIGKTDQFWYAYRTSRGTSYWRVDPKLATKAPLFDRLRLASQLMEMMQKPLDPALLTLSRLSVNDEGTKLKFVADDMQYEYDLASEKLTKLGKAPPPTTLTPPPPNATQEEIQRYIEELRQRREQDQDQQRTNQQQNNQQQDNQQEQNQQQDNQQQNTQQNNQQGTAGTPPAGGQRGRPDHRNYSPDRKAYVFAKGHNLFYVELKDEKKDEPKQEEAKKDEAKKDDVKKDDVKKDEVKKDEVKKEGGKNEEAKQDESKASELKKEDTTKDDTKKDVTKADEVKKTDPAPQEKSDDSKKEEAKKEEAKKDEAKQSTEKKDEAKQEDASKPAENKGTASKPATPAAPVDHDGEAIQLTTDGVEDYSFAGGAGFGGGTTGGTVGSTRSATPITPDRKTRPNVTWSKDSKSFYVSRADSRGVQELWVINSLATPRPTLEKYRYAMPGEEKIRKSELHVFQRDSKKLLRIATKWKDESYSSFQWGKAADELRFVRRDRLLRHIEYCSASTTTGEAKCLIAEGFENAYLVPSSIRYLEDSDELIWWSERSGWGHFYLYGRDGALKNAITSGPFRASQIVDVDPKNRLLYFVGNAREPDENIYFEHLYCVHFDGSGLTLMDPGDASHRSMLSPSKRYLVDNCSRVDRQPCSVLRDASGRQIIELEQADLSRLKEVGWSLPDTFVVKAADGVTDLYGNLWKPFNFDPKKKYPIIAHVYPGPQQEGTNHTFSVTVGDQQLAQLGFIVIQVGHRGGAPNRSKAYANFGYFNLRDYGLADKKAAIEQLAARHDFIDITRVGIYGHSGGGFMTAAALLQKPYNEFFKVGVSTSGNHDNNVYNNSWSERYHGLKEVAVTEQSSTQGARGGGARGQGGGIGTGGFRGRGGGGGPGDATRAETRVSAGGFSVEAGDYFYESEIADDDEAALQEAWLELAAQVDSEQRFAGDDGPQDEKKADGGKSDENKAEEKKADEKKTGDGKASEEKKTRFEIHIPTNAELAGNLKGHLLLVHGELDNNVHPANTLRLVDALIKANKRFDMLYLPGQRHGYGREYAPYVTQRMFEYFAEHLLGDYQPGADIGEKATPRDERR
jgi:dipeptidyl-peptidase-4